MSETIPRDLGERVAAIEATLRQQRASAALRKSRSTSWRGRLRHAPLTALALLVALAPLSLLAASFTDLNPGSVHNANITAIAGAGITKGCDPPGYVNYCPNGLVTREEMASFLARTAGLGGNAPVANAATAVDAAQLGGHPASFYQPAGEPIMNANNAVYAVTAGTANSVLGYAPSALVRVARQIGTNTDASSYSIPSGATFPDFTPMPGTTITITVPGDGFVLVTGAVAVSPDHNVAIYARLRNTSPGAASTNPSPYLAYQGDGGGNFGQGSLNPTFVFPVTGAGPKTFDLELSASAVPTSANLAYNAVMTALYVPFGSGGAAVLGGSEVPEPPTRPAPQR